MRKREKYKNKMNYVVTDNTFIFKKESKAQINSFSYCIRLYCRKYASNKK